MNLAVNEEPGREIRRHALEADRAVFELRRGRSVGVLDASGDRRVASVETSTPSDYAALADEAGALRLVLSSDRLRALGVHPPSPVACLTVPSSVSPLLVQCLAGLEAGRSAGTGPRPDAGGLQVSTALPAEAAGLHLIKQTGLLPALLSAPWHPGVAGAADLQPVAAAAAQHYARNRSQSLARVSEARVPLAVKEDCRFIVYREHFGDAEHVAIVVGNPDTSAAVPVRLHSSCLTGDLFGSLRCDCGEQLRNAVARIDEAGGGVLLYLSHEGRGIGLANKLRAYQLQSDGLDTLQADHYLGFRSDERDYTAACAMLHDLGIGTVRLLTNNPAKIAALVAGGVQVRNRVPLNATENPHNARYMRAKREHAGHLGEDDVESSGAVMLRSAQG